METELVMTAISNPLQSCKRVASHTLPCPCRSTTCSTMVLRQGLNLWIGRSISELWLPPMPSQLSCCLVCLQLLPSCPHLPAGEPA